MLFALVDRVPPVHDERLIHDGGHLVHIGTVESHHTQAHDVGYIFNRLVFAAFQFQFSRKRRFSLDAVFHGCHFHMLGIESIA